jgi:hypothetical protein
VNGSATFSVSASVTNAATLSYQWQKQESGSGSFASISGETNATLNLASLTNDADNGDVYRVVVSASGAATGVTSSSATLTVAAPGVSGYVVSGGASNANGTYCEYGTKNGVPQFKHATNLRNGQPIFIFWDGASWVMGNDSGYYSSNPSASYSSNYYSLNVGGWSDWLGTSPDPTLSITTCVVNGYLVSGDARVQNAPYASQGQPLYPLLSGKYCDTGLTNSEGIPIYRLTSDSNAYSIQYLYLVRASDPMGPTGQWWFIKQGNLGGLSQGAKIQGDSVLQGVRTETPQSSPPSTGWNNVGGTGSITSVTQTTCPI